MKRRNLGARLAILATCICILGGLSSALGVTSAAACATCGPSFTIEKFQEIAGSNEGFTKNPLIGAIGQTVDYEIIVRNTGNVPLEFSEFSDPHCDPGTIAGGPGTGLPGTHTVDPKQSTVYTCSRLLTTPGPCSNEATVVGGTPEEPPVMETSNQVVCEVPSPPPPPLPPPPPAPKPAFTIEKRQEIAGSKAGFTTAQLSGIVGETVDYEVIVTNTGNTPLKFSSFSDGPCDQPTISGGPGEGAVAPGSATTYTCSHLLASAGKYVNVASVLGTAPGATPVGETSNPVEVAVAAPATGEVKCSRAVQPVYHLPTGPKRHAFTVQLSSVGAHELTVYLDGRKLKTFKPSQARNGKFTLTIDPRKLRFGSHKLVVKGVSTEPECTKIAATSAFVRPRPVVHAVKILTG
jgi:hypothetical protein